MKTKNYLWSLLTIMMVVMLSVSMISCGGDDDDDFTPNSGGGGSTNTGDYIATTQVKTVKIKNSKYAYSNGNSSSVPDSRIIYEDYNKKYEIGCYLGTVAIFPYVREYSRWSYEFFNYRNIYEEGKNVGIESVGKVSGLSQITTYCNKEETYSYPKLQPNYGYAAQFMTENGEWKHLRIYVKDYTLDSQGSLETVTYQYQLY